MSSELITKPTPMLFTASAGSSNDRACCTNTAMLESWNVPYKKAEYSASRSGSRAAFMVFTASVMAEKLDTIFGTYTTTSPAMMQTDSTTATLRTKSVPKMATTKMKSPMSTVHSRYGRPVSSLRVAPPVAKATAGATHMTQTYSTSNRLENTGANLP